LTRSTTTYHLKTRAEPQPKPTLSRPNQETARLGTTPQEPAATSEDPIRRQVEWLAKSAAEWRRSEGERWRGEWRAKREYEGEEREGQTEEAARQEQREHETRRVRTPTTTRTRSAPPPPSHPGSTTAQLGLTTERANEVHEGCTRAQETQREGQQEERERTAERGAHPNTSHMTHQTTTTRVSRHSVTTRSTAVTP
jgi:hypothetical protein